MRTYCNNQPNVLEPVGDGSFLYHYDIKQEVVERNEGVEGAKSEQKTVWSCEEVRVWMPVTPNKITEAVITEKWVSNYEQKLLNEYNAVQLGLYDGEEAKLKKEAYINFLKERAAIKKQVDSDCAVLNIQ